MRLGQAAMEALRAEITGCLKPGDELVVACPVALKGTSVIAKNKKDKLAERFSAGFIQNCVSLWDAYGAGSIVWKIAQERKHIVSGCPFQNRKNRKVICGI